MMITNLKGNNTFFWVPMGVRISLHALWLISKTLELTIMYASSCPEVYDTWIDNF